MAILALMDSLSYLAYILVPQVDFEVGYQWQTVVVWDRYRPANLLPNLFAQTSHAQTLSKAVMNLVVTR